MYVVLRVRLYNCAFVQAFFACAQRSGAPGLVDSVFAFYAKSMLRKCPQTQLFWIRFVLIRHIHNIITNKSVELQWLEQAGTMKISSSQR